MINRPMTMAIAQNWIMWVRLFSQDSSLVIRLLIQLLAATGSVAFVLAPQVEFGNE